MLVLAAIEAEEDAVFLRVTRGTVAEAEPAKIPAAWRKGRVGHHKVVATGGRLWESITPEGNARAIWKACGGRVLH